ETVWLNG
ncbi:integrase core domain protein, partial [Vibrio parahaemolyticus VPTS-2010]